MTQRITVVLEYPDDAEIPLIGESTKEFGHSRVRAVAQSDALLELECAHKRMSNEDRKAAFDEMLRRSELE